MALSMGKDMSPSTQFEMKVQSIDFCFHIHFILDTGKILGFSILTDLLRTGP